MIVVCVSLVADDIEQLLVCSFAVRMSSRVRSLFTSFVCFLVGIFAFLPSSSWSSVCVLDAGPLRGCDVQIFPFGLVASLFLPTAGFSSEQKMLNGHEVQLFSFSFGGLCLGAHVWELHA